MARPTRIKVVHVTAHLGGGVGRILSRVTAQQAKDNAGIESTVVCLEPTEKGYAERLMLEAGIRLAVSPKPDQFENLLREADIVQIDWWPHPLHAKWLCTRSGLRARLIIWCHTLGLHYPGIPATLPFLPHAFLFTTPVSLKLANLKNPRCTPGSENIIDFVHSSGGFDDLPSTLKSARPNRLVYGYLGTLNFAKLHPNITSYLKAVSVPDFSVDFYGDTSSNMQLKALAEAAGITKRVNMRGYTDHPYEALAGMDIFVYLLNPCHYGTTENALLEAMASSVVPVVLNNPVESSIVCDGKTGLVVDSPTSFSKAISFLADNPTERLRLGAAARLETLSRFSLKSTAEKLRAHYCRVMDMDRRDFEFTHIFGSSPSEWFASCLGKYRPFFDDADGVSLRAQRLQNPLLYEKSKSSAAHFLRYFPDDARLKAWTTMLENDLASISA